MVLYCMVGVEILKRRLALRSIAGDSVPLDTIVSAPTTSSDQFDTDYNGQPQVGPTTKVRCRDANT